MQSLPDLLNWFHFMDTIHLNIGPAMPRVAFGLKVVFILILKHVKPTSIFLQFIVSWAFEKSLASIISPLASESNQPQILAVQTHDEWQIGHLINHSRWGDLQRGRCAQHDRLQCSVLRSRGPPPHPRR